MGTTTDSESANVCRRKSRLARIRKIQSEGRAIGTGKSNNTTGPRNRRRKLTLSQSRMLRYEGCPSEPTEIEVRQKIFLQDKPYN